MGAEGNRGKCVFPKLCVCVCGKDEHRTASPSDWDQLANGYFCVRVNALVGYLVGTRFFSTELSGSSFFFHYLNWYLLPYTLVVDF